MFCVSLSVELSAVLDQNVRPVTFAVRILNAAAMNYYITEKEYMFVIWVLITFCVFKMNYQ